MQGDLPSSDVRLLLDQGVINRVNGKELDKRPTMQEVIPFSVVERTNDRTTERRRFIAWNRADNIFLKEYEPFVPPAHPAY